MGPQRVDRGNSFLLKDSSPRPWARTPGRGLYRGGARNVGFLVWACGTDWQTAARLAGCAFPVLLSEAPWCLRVSTGLFLLGALWGVFQENPKPWLISESKCFPCLHCSSYLFSCPSLSKCCSVGPQPLNAEEGGCDEETVASFGAFTGVNAELQGAAAPRGKVRLPTSALLPDASG